VFPDAKIICTFHHGWIAGEYVSFEFAQRMNKLRQKLLAAGFEVVSLAGNLQRMEQVYSEAEIHVGYRLHAHLYFLSHRKPSFLLEEDGRSRGASEALGLRGVPAWSRAACDSLLAQLPIGTRIRSVARRALKLGLKPRGDAVEEITAMVKEEMGNNFTRFQGLHLVIAQYYHKALVPFLNTLPEKRHKIS